MARGPFSRGSRRSTGFCHSGSASQWVMLLTLVYVALWLAKRLPWREPTPVG
jgi:uncharacterized membrane protein YhdT